MARALQSRGGPEDVHLAVLHEGEKKPRLLFLLMLLVLPTLAAVLWTDDRIKKLGKK